MRLTAALAFVFALVLVSVTASPTGALVRRDACGNGVKVRLLAPSTL